MMVLCQASPPDCSALACYSGPILRFPSNEVKPTVMLCQDSQPPLHSDISFNHVIVSPCLCVTMSPRRTSASTMSPCHVTMSPCRTSASTVSPCHVTMSPCHHGTLSPWHHGTMSPWHHLTISPCHHVRHQLQPAMTTDSAKATAAQRLSAHTQPCQSE